MPDEWADLIRNARVRLQPFIVKISYVTGCQGYQRHGKPEHIREFELCQEKCQYS